MKKWIWIRFYHGTDIVSAALVEECFLDGVLIEELRGMAKSGPIERIFTESVTIGKPLTGEVMK
jgi:hypothetical protein